MLNWYENSENASNDIDTGTFMIKKRRSRHSFFKKYVDSEKMKKFKDNDKRRPTEDNKLLKKK